MDPRATLRTSEIYMLPLRRGDKKLYCIFLNITSEANYVTQQDGGIEETLFPFLQPVALSLY